MGLLLRENLKMRLRQRDTWELSGTERACRHLHTISLKLDYYFPSYAGMISLLLGPVRRT